MEFLPEWSQDLPPIYDISKSCAENVSQGPLFNRPIPERPKQKGFPIKLFDFELASPLGIPAGPLFNSQWTTLAARLGFDVVTYKTIRSFAHPGHQLPNMIYVKRLGKDQAEIVEEMPNQLTKLTVTNSFGMPSRSPDFLLEDIDRANRALAKGQLLIVSVVGTPNQGLSFRDDFVRTAQIARAGGAKVIEANFSCPNVDQSEGMLYFHPETVYDFTRALVAAIHPIPLILKVGLFPTAEIMHHAFIAAARAGARGICGLNSVSMRVTDQQGLPALGPKREMSGVCGAAIREDALHFLREASKLIHKEKLDLTLLGCGGIMLPSHFDEFLAAKATIAMSATGMMWDPFLALRYHWSKHAQPHLATL